MSDDKSKMSAERFMWTPSIKSMPTYFVKKNNNSKNQVINTTDKLDSVTWLKIIDQ